MMCISDLNPQIQFENLNLNSKIISPMRKTEPARETSTGTVHPPVAPTSAPTSGTPHLAATRPQKQAAKNYWQTKNWSAHTTTTWPTTLASTHTTTNTPMTPSEAIRWPTPYAIWPTPLMEMTTIQELGVTRSYKEYHNQSIYR